MRGHKQTKHIPLKTTYPFLIVLLCTTMLAQCGSHLANPRIPQPLSPIQQTHLAQRNRVQSLMREMTLEQKLGQLIMVEFMGSDYYSSGLQEMITHHYVGGYLFQPINNNFAVPNHTSEAVSSFTAQTQNDSFLPLLIAIDQEGGTVSKLSHFIGEVPSAQQLAMTGNPENAYIQGEHIAMWMKKLGINLNLAPVVDVQSVNTSQQSFIQDRAFGNDIQTVTSYAGSFLDGLQSNGIMATLKHFPGLGSLTVDQDPHYSLYTLPRPLTTLRETDLVPFHTLIHEKQPAMVMTTGVLVPSLDPVLPAVLSPSVVDGMLRQEINYDGVAITDGLLMQGVIHNKSIAEAAVLAIIAGNDIIEGPYTVQQIQEIISALQQAIKDGRLSLSRIDKSVERILSLKVRFGLLADRETANKSK